MLLSTSNSNSRIPEAPYKKQWLLIVIILLLFLTASELFWRSKGYLPNISDSHFFWSTHRSNLDKLNGANSIALLGASRAQLGIDPKIIRETFPDYSVINLTLDGTSPYRILEDIINNSDFNGLLIVSMIAPSLIAWNVDMAESFIRYYHDEFGEISNAEKERNMKIYMWLQQRLVFLSTSVSLKNIIDFRLSQRPSYLYMQNDRFRPAYYGDRMSEINLENHRKNRIRRAKETYKKSSPNKVALFQETLGQLKILNDKYAKRGGRIILFRMPTTGEHWKLDEEAYPRKRYWDLITLKTEITTIHFKDDEILNSFRCPDSSHIDASDVPKFTNRLMQIVKDFLKSDHGSL